MGAFYVLAILMYSFITFCINKSNKGEITMAARKEALQNNQKEYEGKPCNRCGGTLRCTKNYLCVNCGAAGRNEWVAKNKEHLIAYGREYREKNKERIQAYREANKERDNLYHKQYRTTEKNKEYQREYQKEYQKEYYKKNKEQMNAKRRAQYHADKENNNG